MSKSIRTLVTTAVVTLGMLLTAATCTAEEAPTGEPIGNVTFAAEKLTLGQGFIVEPVTVPFYEGENGADIIERAAEIHYTSYEFNGVTYSYISAFADKTSNAELNIPEEIKTALTESGSEIGARTTEGYLSEYDYTASGGYVYFVNDVYPSYGISDYKPADGDVIRFAFTLYGYGSDCGIDNSSWGGAAAVFPAVNRSPLIKLTAEVKGNSEAYAAGIAALTDITATQEQLDEAYNVVFGLYNDESGALVIEPVLPETEETVPDDTTISEEAPVDATEKESPDTGVAGTTTVIAAAAVIGVLMARKRK